MMGKIAQLVRASDCGSEGRGFESPSSSHQKNLPQTRICETADFFMFFAGTLSDEFYDAQKAANFFDVFATAIVFLCDFATVALTLTGERKIALLGSQVV